MNPINYRGRIKSVYKRNEEISRITTGIKKANQPIWDSFAYGSNGTYSSGAVVYRYILMNVSVYDLSAKGENTTVQIDIRDIALKHYKRQNVTDKFIDMLKPKLEGKKITVIKRDFGFFADEEEIVSILKG